MSADIYIEPANPLDLRPKDLETLAEEIRSEQLSVEIRERTQRGYAVTWWEVLYIYVGGKILDGVTGHALQLMLDSLTEKAKHWIAARQKKREKENPEWKQRPFLLEIKDEGGRVLHEFRIDPLPPPSRRKRERKTKDKQQTPPKRGS